jgi:hypothetical protein
MMLLPPLLVLVLLLLLLALPIISPVPLPVLLLLEVKTETSYHHVTALGCSPLFSLPPQIETLNLSYTAKSSNFPHIEGLFISGIFLLLRVLRNLVSLYQHLHGLPPQSIKIEHL